MRLTPMTTTEKWTLTNPPPEGHPDVAAFAYNLFLAGEAEKARLKLPDRWFQNHKLFRGQHWQDNNKGKGTPTRISLGLIFGNIQRTVANLTAKKPVVEAVEIGAERGRGGDVDRDLTSWLKAWWGETEQGQSLVDSAQNMETYGVTVEKAILNAKEEPDTAVIDPYQFGKAPGVFADIQDCPYVYHMAAFRTDALEEQYGLKEGEVEADDTYSILGEDREDNSPIPYGTRAGSQNAPSNYSSVTHRDAKGKSALDAKAIAIEVWLRDNRQGKSGPVYADGIRVITITNNGRLVLADKANPNINWALHDEGEDKALAVAQSYLYGRFPFELQVSYRDTTSNWGFSAAEQTADIALQIDEIVSRLLAAVRRAMLPALILPKDCGVKKVQINNKPGLIIEPNSSAQAGAIRYMEPPRISADIYKTIDLLTGLFDRIWQIQDVDRGEATGGVIAASAIAALQEKNAVLMRHKIRAVDTLVATRGKCAISMLQNFGVLPKSVKVDDQMKELVGIKLAGRTFSFMVEAGSTAHRTSIQTQEQAVNLYKLNAIDREALLDTLNFPGWKRIIERVGEGQLDAALQILVQAGMQTEEAQMLKQALMQPQGGPGDVPQEPQPGIPRAMQG